MGIDLLSVRKDHLDSVESPWWQPAFSPCLQENTIFASNRRNRSIVKKKKACFIYLAFYLRSRPA